MVQLETLLPERYEFDGAIDDSALEKALNHEKLTYSEADIKEIFDKEIYLDIIGTRAFQRLKHIRFLGAIDYLVKPNGYLNSLRHTRYDHSLGVARLALIYSRLNKFEEKQEILCVVSGLLHDIGHGPLSHSMESVFVDKHNISHHRASEEIIRGEVHRMQSLWKVIDSYGINQFEILEVISGLGPNGLKAPFGYSINIDTIEGILRSKSYIYTTNTTFTINEIIYAFSKLNNHDFNLIEILDSFWLMKNDVYANLINSKLGVAADYISQHYIKDNQSIERDDFYSSEVQFKNEHPEIFRQLDMLIEHNDVRLPMSGVKKLEYMKRVFEIDISVEVKRVQDLNYRYLQRKVPSFHVYKDNNDATRVPAATRSKALF